ncbi:MAG TPA: phospholipase domain-containing protein, partial [Phenylobacterium sp.]
AGPRPSRALPYQLDAILALDAKAAHLTLANTGAAGAVFHVYDLPDTVHPPRRYTVGPGERMLDGWPRQGDRYDLWILGPGGFHRHFRGAVDPPLALTTAFDRKATTLSLTLRNTGAAPISANAMGNAYGMKTWKVAVPPGQSVTNIWPLTEQGGWYDLSLTLAGQPGWLRRFAGRLETGRHSISDPAMHGPALMRRDA